MSKLLSSLLRHGFLFEGEDDKGGDKKPDDASGKKSFTQEELDALMGDRARRAGEAANKKLLEDLGVKDPEELKTRLKAAKDAEAASQTDLQKAQTVAADEKKRADLADDERKKALAKADEKLLRAAVMATATAQGVDDAELKTLWLLLKDDASLRAKIKPKAGDEDEFDGVDEVVKGLLTDHPKWLKTETTNVNTNAGNRGTKGTGVAQDELIRRKRASDSGYGNL